MKALFIYNPISGHHLVKKRISYIYHELNPIYEVFDVVASLSKEHFCKVIKEDASKYDVLIISGGDGTINMTINILATLEKRPILGIIPLGTINDCVKSFDNPKSFKKSIALIKNGQTKKVDIFQANDSYVSYVAAYGAYSDIPYITGNRLKKIFGRFAYYFHAIPRLFKKIRVNSTLIIDGQETKFITPFLLVMNGRRMGGFTINKHANPYDGKADIYYAKPGIFNSLLKYFFTRNRLIHIQANEFIIDNENALWDIDGEIGPRGKISFKVLPKFLEIFG